jgi:hypothetical protein
MFRVEHSFVQRIKFYKYTDAKSLLFLPPEIAEIRYLCLCVFLTSGYDWVTVSA